MENTLDQVIAERLKQARRKCELTIEELSAASGVSRAMISRIERGEASPTAVLLARLCAALGLSLSTFFAEEGENISPLARHAQQPVWRDPGTGYLRRSVSPAHMPSQVDLVEVEFPAGARVSFPPQALAQNECQHLWLFEGVLTVTLGEDLHELMPGDCLFMRLGTGHVFHNPGARPARYAVIFERRYPTLTNKEFL